MTSHTVTKNRFGFVVSTTSNETGAVTGRVVLVYFSKDTPENMSLDRPWNVYRSNREILVHIAINGGPNVVKVLEEGILVQ